MSQVDQQFVVGIKVLGNPVAELVGLRIHDNTTGVWYAVIPEGQLARCTPGALAGHIVFGVRNKGTIAGTIYIKAEIYKNGVLDKVLIAEPRDLPADPTGYPSVVETDFDMPAEDIEITVTLGH